MKQAKIKRKVNKRTKNNKIRKAKKKGKVSKIRMKSDK